MMIPFKFEVKYDEDSGFRGLRQIWQSLRAARTPNGNEIYERHAAHYLNRCFPDWMKEDPESGYILFTPVLVR